MIEKIRIDVLQRLSEYLDFNEMQYDPKKDLIYSGVYNYIFRGVSRLRKDHHNLSLTSRRDSLQMRRRSRSSSEYYSQTSPRHTQRRFRTSSCGISCWRTKCHDHSLMHIPFTDMTIHETPDINSDHKNFLLVNQTEVFLGDRERKRRTASTS